MGLAKVGLNAVKVLEIASISLSGETAGELGIHSVLRPADVLLGSGTNNVGADCNEILIAQRDLHCLSCQNPQARTLMRVLAQPVRDECALRREMLNVNEPLYRRCSRSPSAVANDPVTLSPPAFGPLARNYLWCRAQTSTRASLLAVGDRGTSSSSFPRFLAQTLSRRTCRVCRHQNPSIHRPCYQSVRPCSESGSRNGNGQTGQRSDGPPCARVALASGAAQIVSFPTG